MFANLAKVPTFQAARAINRALASGQTVGVREVARDLKLRQADVRKFVKVEPATKFKLLGRIYASAKRLPVILFGARQTRSGVTARTAQRTYPGAFIATMGSGHTGVFMRKTPTRSRKGKPRGSPALPIRELFTVSIAHVFIKHLAAIRARAIEQLAKNLAHEVKRAAKA
jgi:predicted transcriptional regulator